MAAYQAEQRAQFSMRRQCLLDRLALAAVCLGMTYVVAVAVSGGGVGTFDGIRISARTVFRPMLIVVAMVLATAAWSADLERQLKSGLAALRHRSGPVAVCLIALSFAAAVRFGSFEAGASDQYGYVSEAGLWLDGKLTIVQPLATKVPWPDADQTLSPLGYRPGRTPGTIVPTYPPGLPLTMAALFRVIGPTGVYLVVPLLGALTVWLTFLLGRRFAGPDCGVMAATLVLSSPTFLFHLNEPMSDVPVTAWWLLSVVLAIRGTGPGAFGSGLAASAAILTRPNLAPLLLPLAGYILASSASALPRRFRDLGLMGAGALPGCIAVAVINSALYGSPLASGYGPLASIFSVRYALVNLGRYARWLFETETLFIAFALAAPWAFIKGKNGSRLTMWLFLEMAGVLFTCYLFYLPMQSWTYLRFLLLAIPLMLILSSGVALTLWRRYSSHTRQLWFVALFCLLVAWRWDTAVSHGVQTARVNDRRFAALGLFVRDELPKQAVILTILHSGSVRHYSQRLTLRWDWLDPGWLDPAVAFLKASGYRPYLLIEDSERSQFERRFSGNSEFSGLDWPPVGRYDRLSRVSLYDPDDRSRFLSGEAVKTRQINPVSGSPLSLARLSGAIASHR